MIKILIGGSPCTHWSIAKTKDRETEPQGLGWELFKNYRIARDKFNPDFFLYENNKSAAQPIKDKIAEELGVEIMYINSALVSAQNRQRFYAFNWSVNQPIDRGILIKDIIEQDAIDIFYDLDADKISPPRPNKADDVIRIGVIENEAKNQAHDSKQYRVYSPQGKGTTLCGNGGGLGAKTGLYAIPLNTTAEGKAQCLRATCYKDGIRNLVGNNVDRRTCVAVPVNTTVDGKAYAIKAQYGKSAIANFIDASHYPASAVAIPSEYAQNQPVYEVKGGFILIKGTAYPIDLADGFYVIRKLTVTECCRLQTMPDDYCKSVSKTQAYKGLGNGWTAEVIIHILNGALGHIDRHEKIVVLSMYDGIGTGRYCLDKMGFTNVEYHAYEIDEAAMKIANDNYPDIIQHGDAFQVRNADWIL